VTKIELALDGGGAFALVSAPNTPVVLPPQAEAQLALRFAPLSEGQVSGTLRIESDDPDTPVLTVELQAFGVGLAQQAQDLVWGFDEGLAEGDLVGSGPGNSGTGRAGALRNMLERAAELVEAERFADACNQLREARRRTDGAAPPPDFVEGPAAPELAGQIETLRTHLACS
jgi:hypothetical protein